jgi:hypothetical protein
MNESEATHASHEVNECGLDLKRRDVGGFYALAIHHDVHYIQKGENSFTN